MPTKAELGRRLRVARFERNMTLKEVAARCGMSATHISEVERGKTSPTIGALQRITAALGEKTSYFVQENDLPRVRLTRLADRRDVYTADAEGVPVRIQAVSAGIPGGYVQIFTRRIEPGSVIHRRARIGEAVTLCIAGMVRITAMGESYVLREGDTIQLRWDEGSTYENVGDEESETITVLSAPTLVKL
ncbi:MAG: helix-turn-helix domain-containing protein [Chloroflexi bacterium]|nr:helix-turn-helix domain-containing protein [Chloroflexota bacterium]